MVEALVLAIPFEPAAHIKVIDLGCGTVDITNVCTTLLGRRFMVNDEQAIRDLVRAWMRTSMVGDLPQILELMADDVLFLTPGREPSAG
jgi:hypothetical protein